jgi:hypothetical protein
MKVNLTKITKALRAALAKIDLNALAVEAFEDDTMEGKIRRTESRLEDLYDRDPTEEEIFEEVEGDVYRFGDEIGSLLGAEIARILNVKLAEWRDAPPEVEDMHTVTGYDS